MRHWDIQWEYNGWISFGFHIDHTDPSIAIHLPIAIILIGRCRQPGFRRSLWRWLTGKPYDYDTGDWPYFDGPCSQIVRYADHERPEEAQCYDCGLLYNDPSWIEAVVPDGVWEIINPTYHQGGGLLCANCIARRLYMAGLSEVPVKLTAGPLVTEETDEHTRA